MKTIRRFAEKSASFLAAAFILFTPVGSFADGCFVAPKFVWDKYKDINEPTQKAIIVYDAGREDLILQVKYEGPTDEFGWLVPVPNLPEVKLGSMKCFYELSQYTQRLWDRPFFGGGQHHGFTMGLMAADSLEYTEPPVRVIKIKTVGAYKIAVLSTKDATALEHWLDVNKFYFPAEKKDVIDFYVKQQFYFVAVKIDTSKSSGFKLLAPRQAGNELGGNYQAYLELASGELNPLQISFASDRCMFPLKISSVNGKPSEVQVYVLSPEPLLEREMLKNRLPSLYHQAMAEAAQRADRYLNSRHSPPGLQTPEKNSLPLNSPVEQQEAERIRQMPVVSELNGQLNFTKVTEEDLPKCSRVISRLAGKSWWLAKETWPFKPEEMHDLEFTPAFVN